MTAASSEIVRKAVVVHAGARDSYQVAIALSQAGLLDSLVTDLLWPADRPWAARLGRMLPGSIRELLRRRTVPHLPSREVRMCVGAGLRVLLLERLKRVPVSIRRDQQRAADAVLGRAAGDRAREAGAGLVTYSYYGYDAMRAYGRPAMLFQVHPHPGTVRRILREELAAHPDCAASLTQEWELALPEQEYEHLVAETGMAAKYLAASSFTRASLVEHGTRAEDIAVIPYGVDTEHFHPAPEKRPAGGPLELLFVGRINQRKGLKYLLAALEQFSPAEVHLTICGRVVDDLAIFREFADRITIRPSVTEDQLVAAYQSAELFVFPSVAEGFGQVLLESLASGLPILATTSTAAPDLIEDSVQGFIVEPRRPDLLAARITWALSHREELRAMGLAARTRAEQFTWARFRSRVAEVVGAYLAWL